MIPAPMADAARIAHPTAPRSSPVVATVALALALWPLRVQAEPMPDAGPDAGPDAVEPADDADEPIDATEDGATPEDSAATDEATPEDDSIPEDGTADEVETQTETDEVETQTDEVEADEVDETESSALGPTAEPLRPLQTAAWWTMFGAFTVGTAAGVLSGLAERQEDRATRLSTLFDTNTGAQPRYADRQDEYEQYLRRGEAYAKAAIGVGVVAGAATVAAIALFAVDARRQRSERAPTKHERAALRLRAGGMEVRF